MEVTDRLGGVTQVIFQYDIPSYCHKYYKLISNIQQVCSPCALSPVILFSLCTNIAKCGLETLQTKNKK